MATSATPPIDLRSGFVPRKDSPQSVDLSAGLQRKPTVRFDPNAPYSPATAAQQTFTDVQPIQQPQTFTNVVPIKFDPAVNSGDGSANDQAAPKGSNFLDRAKDAADLFVKTLPGVGSAHELASVINDWANRKMSPENPHMFSPAATFGTGVARDVSGLVKGATSPAGLATAGATIAAPEVMGPALVGHGIYSAVTG